MAELNGVQDRLVVSAYCSEDTFLSIPVRARCLVISDCEGFESRLFSPRVVEHGAKYGFLIEIHDVMGPGISGSIRTRSSSSHTLEVVSSIDDIKKGQTYSFTELDGLDLRTRCRLLAERRPTIMEWFPFKPNAVDKEQRTAHALSAA